MAKIYRLDDQAHPIPNSEKVVLESFERLSDDWHIFHSVRWQSVRHGRQGDGEADFIILHREFGALVLEVKGGEIAIDAGRWVSTGRDGLSHSIRNPYAQAADSKHALIGFLDSLLQVQRSILVGHAVAFPSIEQGHQLGPAANRETTLYASDLLDSESALLRAFAHWQINKPFSQKALEQVIRLLAPSVNVQSMLKTDVMRSEAQLVTLTEQQQRTFENLRGLRRLVVTGGAGSGKTLLALARARNLADQGFRTRVVCYNELLGKALALACVDQPAVDVTTFHRLCMSGLQKHQAQCTVGPNSRWWDDEAPVLLKEAIASRGPSIDALVIDEAQDFSPLWFEALAFDLRDSEGPMYVFADDRQTLWRRNWRDGLGIDATYNLSDNCRNTIQIARRLAELYRDPVPLRGAHGAAPAIVTFERGDDVVAMILELAERLLDEQGLAPDDLLILCDEARMVERLRETYVAARPITGFGGHGVVCETVARFKGLESPVVLLVLADNSSVEDQTTTAYIGLSRARSAAVVLARVGHPVIDAFARARQRK